MDVPARHPLLANRSMGVILLAPFLERPPERCAEIKCLYHRAKQWRFSRLEVRWLFGPAVTCETELAAFNDPVQPGTDAALDELADCNTIVAAWGDEGDLLRALLWDRCWNVGRRLQQLSGKKLQSFGYTDGGYPAAPGQLYVRYMKLQPFRLEHFTYPPAFRGTSPLYPEPVSCA